MTAVSEPSGATTPAAATNGATPAQAKPGRHREATLYHALAGAGAGDGRTLAQLREAALAAYDASELPVWRRSGFWTTSLQSLDLDALSTQPSPAPDGVPDVVTRTLPDRPRAGRIVQSAGSVVHVELDAELAGKGVILCSLEDAFRDHRELVAPWYSKRLTIDRNKLEAANAAFWTGGAFLHVPEGLVVEDPFEIVYAIDSPASRSTGARWSSARRRASFACTSTTSPRTSTVRRCTRAPSSCTCRTALAAAWRRCRTGARERCSTSPTRFVGVGRDAHCHWLPSLLGGHLVRQHLELAVSEPGGDMAFRGLFFTEEHEHLDVFAVDLHETGRRAATCTGAARRPARAARASRA